MKRMLVFFTLLFISIGCYQDDYTPPKEYELAIENCLTTSTENNPTEKGDRYAEFMLKNKHVVMADGHDNYRQVNEIWYTYWTSEPILQPHNGGQRLLLGFDDAVIDPSLPTQVLGNDTDDQLFLALNGKIGASMMDMIDQHFKLGDLPLQQVAALNSPNRDSTDGFTLQYWCNCQCGREGAGKSVLIETISPAQSGYVRCTKLERSDLGDSVRYKINLEMDCDMFAAQPTGPEKFFDRLKGKMFLDFMVKK